MKPSFDIAFFSFNRHQDKLIPGLKNVIKHVPDFNEIILVWDDFVRERPIDFDQVQEELDHPIRVIKHTELYDWPDSLGRWGWIKQQLAKMLCYTYSTSEYTWICDGDIQINADPELFHDNLPVIRTSKKPIELHVGYYHFMKKYFRMEHLHPTVLINGGGNCMMHNKIVEEMWQVCQQWNGKSLIECVQYEIENTTDLFPFSEFETYGNYCLTHYPDQFYLTNSNWGPNPNFPEKVFPIQLL
jgi:hypothetical protein